MARTREEQIWELTMDFDEIEIEKDGTRTAWFLDPRSEKTPSANKRNERFFRDAVNEVLGAIPQCSHDEQKGWRYRVKIQGETAESVIKDIIATHHTWNTPQQDNPKLKPKRGR